jgi:hypothetical protein
MSSCPLCSAKYDLAKVRLVEESDGVQLLHITCDECKSAVVTALAQEQGGVFSVGALTDLSVSELAASIHNNGITKEDLLDLHIITEKDDLVQALGL